MRIQVFIQELLLLQQFLMQKSGMHVICGLERSNPQLAILHYCIILSLCAYNTPSPPSYLHSSSPQYLTLVVPGPSITPLFLHHRSHHYINSIPLPNMHTHSTSRQWSPVPTAAPSMLPCLRTRGSSMGSTPMPCYSNPMDQHRQCWSKTTQSVSVYKSNYMLYMYIICEGHENALVEKCTNKRSCVVQSIVLVQIKRKALADCTVGILASEHNSD